MAQEHTQEAPSLSSVDVLRRQLDDACDELTATSEELRFANRELERADEELHATVAELEKANDELERANHELGCMNLEVSATSQELRALNDQVGERTAELDHANAMLESVIDGIEQPVVVLDCDLAVRAWSPRSEDLWGPNAAAVRGRSLLALQIGLPVEELAVRVRGVVGGEVEDALIELDAVDRRGREVRCSVRAAPVRGPAGQVAGSILVFSLTDD